MPELPDIQVCLAALEQRILDRTLERIRLGTPLLLRSVTPPLTATASALGDRQRLLG